MTDFPSSPESESAILSVGEVQGEFYAWWNANQVDRLHGMIAQNCALAAWHDAYDRYVRKARTAGHAPAPQEPLSLKAAREDERMACWKIADKERTALKNADPTKAAWLVAFDIANAIKARGYADTSTTRNSK